MKKTKQKVKKLKKGQPGNTATKIDKQALKEIKGGGLHFNGW